MTKGLELARELVDSKNRIVNEIRKVIVGQDEVLEDLLVALFCKGHCLFVGVPGLAKTLLVKTLARVLNLSFSRIQFTPDLMPSDITGTDILYEDQTTNKRGFRFIKGPVFSNIVLADEINRTPPKTQAALLQAMQEQQVTVGGNTYELDQPFLVFATQNPIEHEGTYPLPEAQLDRFVFELHIDYPSASEEEEIARATTTMTPVSVKPILRDQQIVNLQQLTRRVPISDHLIQCAVELVRSSRPADPSAPPYVSDLVNWGAGPRASQHLVLTSKARAILHGRHTVAKEDLLAVASPVLRHRIVVNFHAEAENLDGRKVVERLLTEDRFRKKLEVEAV